MVAEKNNATCSICGKSYHKCLSCRDSMKLQPWKMYTDSAEHYKVFQAVRGYNTSIYTKDEFKSKLKNIDLSDLESYEENVKALIKDVLKDKKFVAETVLVEEEGAIVETPVYSRKRNYKVNKVEANSNVENEVVTEVVDAE